MRRYQLGLGLGGLMVGAVIFIVLATIGMKLTPSYIEFFSIKRAVNAIASETKGGGTVAEVRKSFDMRAVVDAIETVKGSDLEVTKEGGSLLISVAYRKEVPLVANVGLYIDFRASSKE